MKTEQLTRMLLKMDIPVQRKSLMNKNNLTWLHKNLSVRNSTHKNYEKVIAEVDRRLAEKQYEN